MKYEILGGAFQEIDAGNRLNVTVSNLMRNTKYQFAVRASYAGNGTSPFFGQYGDPQMASPGMSMCNLFFYFTIFPTYHTCAVPANNCVKWSCRPLPLIGVNLLLVSPALYTATHQCYAIVHWFH